MKRVFLAFLLAPLVPLLLLELVDIAGSSSSARTSGNVGLFAVIMLLYVYPTTAIVGLPVFCVFQRKGWYHWWQVLLGGVCIGIAPSLLSLLLALFVEMRMSELIATWLPFAGLGAAFGAIGALAFRVIAFPLRLDPRHPIQV